MIRRCRASHPFATAHSGSLYHLHELNEGKKKRKRTSACAARGGRIRAVCCNANDRADVDGIDEDGEDEDEVESDATRAAEEGERRVARMGVCPCVCTRARVRVLLRRRRRVRSFLLFQRRKREFLTSKFSANPNFKKKDKRGGIDESKASPVLPPSSASPLSSLLLLFSPFETLAQLVRSFRACALSSLEQKERE